MKKEKIQTLKGFRDFLPAEARKRAWLRQRMIKVFEKYGYEPLETPALEYASLLLGKYGEEADKLVYTFGDRGGRRVGLRYDQTVPLARVVSEHLGDENNVLNNSAEFLSITKRYQIQDVFRAEKPQKGRYREFTQCDCDILGSRLPKPDAEILAVFYEVFRSLGLNNVSIQYNDKEQLIDTFSTYPLFNSDRMTNEEIWEQRVNKVIQSLFQSFDKLDKKSKEEVVSELIGKGFEKNEISEIFDTLEKRKLNQEVSQNTEGIIRLAISLGVPKANLVFNPFLARGLDYYTDLIFEAVLPDTKGSLGGGGRYDNLIPQLSENITRCDAVGFGIGFDRTLEVLEEKNLLPLELLQSTAKVLVSTLNEDCEFALEVASKLRKQGVNTEVFTDYQPLEKQLKYADKKGIKKVIIIGPDEAKEEKVVIKNMQSGEQEKMSINSLIEKLSNVEPTN